MKERKGKEINRMEKKEISSKERSEDRRHF